MSDRIVVLDGFTTNPGDLDWAPLASLGPLTVYDRTSAVEVVSRMGDASYALLNKTQMSGEALSALPSLRYIGVLATGYNTVDLAAARDRKITVTNVPTYATQSVAEHAAAMMLDFAHGLAIHDAAVRAGEWARSPDWCFTRRPVFELCGRTLGLIGLGRIGAALARIAAALGLRLTAYDPALEANRSIADLNIKPVTLEELLKTADIISLHCPLTPQTHHLINAETLSRMKRTAMIINTSRGPLLTRRRSPRRFVRAKSPARP
jgi:glycerate dehydrogenase